MPTSGVAAESAGLSERDVLALIDRRLEQVGPTAQLQAAVARLGNAVSVRRGRGVFSFPGGTSVSGVVAVAHGLGGTPVVVHGSVEDDGTTAQPIVFMPIKDSYTPTQFRCMGHVSALTPFGGGGPFPFLFDWVAIG